MDDLPDIRDGLTRLERIILVELHALREEYGDRHVPTPLLFGRVSERIDVSKARFEAALRRLVGTSDGS